MSAFTRREKTVMSNYGYNAPRDRFDLVYGQGDPGVAALRYGKYSMDYNGCELIALHNAMLLSGRKSSLADVARFMSERGYMWSPLGIPAAFGTRLRGIAAFLRGRDIPFTRIPRRTLSRPEGRAGDIFILAYFSGRLHIHTVTLRRTETGWEAWNLRPRASGCTRLDSLTAIAPRRKLLRLYRLDRAADVAKRTVL